MGAEAPGSSSFPERASRDRGPTAPWPLPLLLRGPLCFLGRGHWAPGPGRPAMARAGLPEAAPHPADTLRAVPRLRHPPRHRHHGFRRLRACLCAGKPAENCHPHRLPGDVPGLWGEARASGLPEATAQPAAPAAAAPALPVPSGRPALVGTLGLPCASPALRGRERGVRGPLCRAALPLSLSPFFPRWFPLMPSLGTWALPAPSSRPDPAPLQNQSRWNVLEKTTGFVEGSRRSPAPVRACIRG